MSNFRKEIVERAAQMMVARLDGDDSDDGQSARTSDAEGEEAYFNRRALERKHQRQIRTLWGGIGLASVADVVEIVQFVLGLFSS